MLVKLWGKSSQLKKHHSVKLWGKSPQGKATQKRLSCWENHHPYHLVFGSVAPAVSDKEDGWYDPLPP